MLLGELSPSVRSLLYLPILAKFRAYSSSNTPQPSSENVIDIQPSYPDQPVQRLTKQQKEEFSSAVLKSFKQDQATSAGLIVKSLDDDAKRELLQALEGALEPPELSRTAMAGELPAADAAQHSQQQHHPGVQAALVPTAAVEAEVAPPSLKQLLRVAATRGIPFVAFGFFDNMIMITAGEQIDVMFGAKLGLSSMAAAGLGNTIADVVGINISHTIEQKFKVMKQMAPQLTKAQMKLPQTKRAAWLGCAVGMAVGCLLGLTPLLFFGEAEQLDGAQADKHAHGSTSRSKAAAAAS